MDYDIYPVHTLDGRKGVQKCFMIWMMQFNDVLDPHRLHRALSRLLELGDWRKLGGRLCFNENGKLEIHVPRPFTADRPAVAFAHDDLTDTSIDQHPWTRRLPRPTSGPSVHVWPPGAVPSFVQRPDAPASLEELVRRQAPQLSLQVASFSDATLVTVSWPHTLMDAVGQRELLRAWSLVLAGREQEVQPMLGARTDVLAEATAAPGGKDDQQGLGCRPEMGRLRGIRLACLYLRMLWDAFWNPLVGKAIFLPESFLGQLRRQAEDEAAASNPRHGNPEKSAISESDVLTAWCARLVALSQPRPRPVAVLSAVNARFRLSSLRGPEGVHVQNMVLNVCAPLPAWLATSPLGCVALAFRRHLAEQATERRLLGQLREAGDEAPTLYGETDAVPVIVNNTTRVDIIHAADFAAAVLRRGDDSASRLNPPGSMVFHVPRVLGFPVKASCFLVTGKDHEGNSWLGASLSSRAWAKVDEEMGRAWAAGP